MEFNEWVKKQNEDFFKPYRRYDKENILSFLESVAANKQKTERIIALNGKKYPFIVSCYKKGKTVVLRLINPERSNQGIAICHENDTFSAEIEIAYAWARYKKEPIPNFTVKLNSLKYGDFFIEDEDTYIVLAPSPFDKNIIFVINEHTHDIHPRLGYLQVEKL